MALKRTAAAHWAGSGKDGKGTLSAPGGVLKNTPYSFASRFESTPGTNPEELIAAAHAGCFTMASLTMEQVGAGWSISAIHLDLGATIPGIDEAKFQALAADAKANCPVSKVLNAKITLTATLKK